MALKRYILRKGLEIALTFFSVTVIIFFLVRLIPGDPAYAALGESATREQVERFRSEMGFDKSLPEQYLIFLTNIFSGKLGLSGITLRDAMTDLLYYFPATFELTIVSMVIALSLGILLGVTAGLTNNEKVDNALSFFSISGLSSPSFLVAILLQVTVASQLGLLPVTGRIESMFVVPRVTGLMLIDSLLAGNLSAFLSALRCLILPAFTLAFAPMATIMRLVRANTIKEKGKSYVATLKVNGLPNSLLKWRYLFPNVVSPALTIAGLQFANMLGGSFVIETIFVFPGNGWLGVQAMIGKDINLIQGVALLASIYFIICNFLVDFLHTRIDPRIRFSEKAD